MAATTRPYAATELAPEARAVSVGSWLFVAADAFFFAAWYFAFFYLRALNNNNAWMAAFDVHRPNRAIGTAVMLLVALSAAVYLLASRLVGTGSTWRPLATIALVLGLAGGLYQAYEMWHLGFGLTDGGYPSVFAGLTGTWVVQVLAAMVWLAGSVVQARPGGDTLLRPTSAVAFSRILGFLAVIGVISYILLYFV